MASKVQAQEQEVLTSDILKTITQLRAKIAAASTAHKDAQVAASKAKEDADAGAENLKQEVQRHIQLQDELKTQEDLVQLKLGLVQETKDSYIRGATTYTATPEAEAIVAAENAQTDSTVKPKALLAVYNCYQELLAAKGAAADRRASEAVASANVTTLENQLPNLQQVAKSAEQAEAEAAKHLETLQGELTELQERANNLDTRELVLVIATNLELVSEDARATRATTRVLAANALEHSKKTDDKVTQLENKLAQLDQKIEGMHGMLARVIAFIEGSGQSLQMPYELVMSSSYNNNGRSEMDTYANLSQNNLNHGAGTKAEANAYIEARFSKQHITYVRIAGPGRGMHGGWSVAHVKSSTFQYKNQGTGSWVDMPDVTAQIKSLNQEEIKKINIDRETTAIRLYNQSGYVALGFLQVFKRS